MGYGYATHLPALIDAVLRTTGPVLELGAGEFSTPILHELVAKRGRPLFTVEADDVWRSRFHALVDGHPADHSKRMHILADSLESPGLQLPERLSVVLIDQAPAAERGVAVERFAGRADWLVCHDWGVAAYRWPADVMRWRSARLWSDLMPWTMVLGGFRGK
jgi:hypothetical protein